MREIQAFMEKPLSNLEIGIIFAAMLLLIGLLIWVDICRNARNCKKFLKQHPNAALICVFVDGEPAMQGRFVCSKGNATPLFRLPASGHPSGERGLAFYSLPGLVQGNLMVQSKQNRQNAAMSGRLSFCAEANAVYQAEFSSRDGTLKMELLRGNDLHFLREDAPSEDIALEQMRFDDGKRPASDNILGCFYVQETKRLFLSGLLLAVPIAYLVLAAGQSPWLWLLPVGLPVLMWILMFAVGAKRYQKIFDGLTMQQQDDIMQEFAVPHPIYRLFGGEVHLLPSCLICRHGGKLSLILLDQIVSAQSISYSQTMHLTKTLMLNLKTGQTHQLEFTLGHQKDLLSVLAWLKQKNPAILQER